MMKGMMTWVARWIKQAMSRKALPALLLCLCLALSLTACTSGGMSAGSRTDSGSSAANESEPVTLTIWNNEILSPGIQNNDVAREIEQRLGIRLEVVQGDAQRFSLLLANGNLPDIIYSNYAQQGVEASELITSGQLLPLEELIGEYGPDIQKNFPERLKFSGEFTGEEDGHIYYIPVLCYEADPEEPAVSYSIENVGLMTRWDLYRDIGAPEIRTTEDYLDVLEEMQMLANERKDSGGDKVYAISGWSDWGLWPWWVANVRESGYLDLANNAIMNRETRRVEMLYDSEVFWESLNFYNRAYRRGILDPEAFTMKSDQFWEKCESGQVLMAYASWQTDAINKIMAAAGHPERGFEKLPHDGYPYISGIYAADAPIGQGIEYATAITTNCRHPEKAIELINFCNSEEGARLLFSGVEGVHWEYTEKGAAATDDLHELMQSDVNYTMTSGLNLYNKLSGFSEKQILSDGSPAGVLQSDREKAAEALPIDRDYCDYYGALRGKTYDYPGMVLADLEQSGEIENQSESAIFTLIARSPGSEALDILSRCNQYMNSAGVRAIMAPDDEAFAAVRAEAEAELTALEFPRAAEEILQRYREAEERAAWMPES